MPCLQVSLCGSANIGSLLLVVTREDVPILNGVLFALSIFTSFFLFQFLSLISYIEQLNNICRVDNDLLFFHLYL